jgi:hypothetical protein
MIEEL